MRLPKVLAASVLGDGLAQVFGNFLKLWARDNSPLLPGCRWSVSRYRGASPSKRPFPTERCSSCERGAWRQANRPGTDDDPESRVCRW